MSAYLPLHGVTIAFDLDGTLVDTAPDLVATLNLMLADEGLPSLAMADAQPLIGYGARRLIERGFEAAGVALTEARTDEIFDRFIPHYMDHIADESRAFPGCVAALETLRAGGAKLAVCTNKRTDMSRLLLDALGMSPLFDAVMGPDEAGARKPDPRHLAAAIAAAGGSLDRAIMVGDAATDAGVAKAAGAGLILVRFGYTDIPVEDLGADILIDYFDELTQACAALVERGADAR